MLISQELQAKIQKLVESFGCKIYDITTLKENENQILRISITKKPSVSLDDCQEVSLALSPLLDVEIPNFEKYYLEVSSPGIERPLKTKEHFEDAIGELLKIKTTSKQDFKGKLIAIDNESLKLESGEIIPISEIKKAQTYFEW
ncbi:ribosome maturation factor RimP [Helicobacter pullorum]|uniref:Ribosome maturation factor RimP n=1 Tax=Helicobacter pullorum TaxID=35818 RepID=A0AAW3J8C6_9HELI|nr:ribosome maturation factor RimP [Helicobacter pullorum]KPH50108.1 ribosome maturation factor RimP [Helicobacter pullorum]